MAKRFTETDKWTKNKWFRKLPKDIKLFWLFICDNCDCVGVWEEDVEFVCDTVGIKTNIQTLQQHLNGQVQIIQNGKKWWIINFCFFQYGVLIEENIKNKPHQKYISELKKHRLWIDYQKTINSLEEKEEEEEADTEEEMEKEKEMGVQGGILTFPFPSEEFAIMWGNWKTYKKEQHKFTFKSVSTEQAALNNLTKISGGLEQKAIEIILQSISQGWKGFFELTTSNNGNRNNKSGNTGNSNLKQHLAIRLSGNKG